VHLHFRSRAAIPSNTVLARTLKGKGLIGIEGLEGWHGKVLDKPAAAKVIAELESNLSGVGEDWKPNLPSTRRNCSQAAATVSSSGRKPPYAIGGEEVATRNGFADGLAALANADPRIVVLDGDVKNSTYAEEFEKVASARFFGGYIAEQNIVGMAMGLAARGKVSFASLFSCFVTRAYDFIRLVACRRESVTADATRKNQSNCTNGGCQLFGPFFSQNRVLTNSLRQATLAKTARLRWASRTLPCHARSPTSLCSIPPMPRAHGKPPALIANQAGPCYLRLGRPKSAILYGPDE